MSLCDRLFKLKPVSQATRDKAVKNPKCINMSVTNLLGFHA